jgi:dynactin complex subunit
MQSSSDSSTFKLDQRVHSTNDPRRIGTVKYIGAVEGHPGTWVGVDWDNGEAKHDGSLNGVRYFEARSQLSGSFVRAQNLTAGISFIEALYIRYRDQPTQEDEGMSASSWVFLYVIITFSFVLSFGHCSIA